MNLSILAFMMPGPFEMCIIAGIVLLLFGNRLPGAMRSMGRSITEFKTGMKEGEDEQLSDSRGSETKDNS